MRAVKKAKSESEESEDSEESDNSSGEDDSSPGGWKEVIYTSINKCTYHQFHAFHVQV